MPIEDIPLEALNQLNVRRRYYRTYDNYYRGQHQLAFASDKFRNAFGNLFQMFADNICPIPIDSLADRLEIIGFSDTGDASLAVDAQEIWDRNHMTIRAGRIHRSSFVNGDGFTL